MFRHLIFSCTLLALSLGLVGSVTAQEARSLPDDNWQAFQAPDLPTPNRFRSGSGKPGAGYWQQEADYDIQVRLDTTDHQIIGSEVITYTNNSPYSLEYLWIQLEQNLFAPSSRGNIATPPDARFRGAFPEGGVDIQRVELTYANGEEVTPEYVITDTRMRIHLEEPLPPNGSTMEIGIDWSFIIPAYGADRMGRFHSRDGWVYELAQWYPRMYVFDDVSGWNPLPYLGQGEFYTEFGDFNVAITVPRDVIVVATGVLQNPEQVLTAQQRKRLDEARNSAETVSIIPPDMVGSPETRPEGEGPLTWRFHAENVRDFAWAASRAFIWDAASWQDVLLMSVYPQEGLSEPGSDVPGWEKSTQFVRHSISFYSKFVYPYPYPVAINVGGVVGGMEYPMISFCAVDARGKALFGVTDHEFGHMWFPMYVQNNERRYAWMDEGLDTFMNYYSNRAFYGPDGTSRILRLMQGDFIARRMRSEIGDQPIMTEADHIQSAGLGFVAYRKPAYGLILLRELIIGPERFDSAFREYVERWAGKHPRPADFFRTIEDVAGEDLGWFWKGWFYQTDLLDQAIDSVTVSEGNTQIYLSNKRKLVMPVIMQVTFEDGTSERMRLPVAIWQTSDYHKQVIEGPRTVVSVRLDPGHLLPDINRENNYWSASVESEASSSP